MLLRTFLHSPLLVTLSIATKGETSVALDPDKIRAARDAVLADPEFKVVADWRTRALDWLLTELERLSGHLPDWLRVLTLGLLVAGLIALIVWLLPSSSRRRDAVASANEEPEAAVDFAAERARAAQALAEGRLADCVRAAWLSAVGILRARGITSVARGETDWEHVEAGARARAELGGPLAILARTFQLSHFGARPLEVDEAERCLVELDALTRLASSPAAGTAPHA